MNHFQKGNVLAAQRRYEEAIDAFLSHAEEVPSDKAKALTRAAECCDFVNTLPAPLPVAGGAAMLVSVGDRDTAERFYRTALEANPRYARALRGLSRILPDNDERQRLLEAALDSQADLLTMLELGDFYRSVLKDHARAHELYVRAAEHTPNDKSAYLKLIDLCRRMGNVDEARQWSRRWKERSR